MISVFKSNNPAVVLFYVPYIVLFRLCCLFDSSGLNVSFQNTEPLSAPVFQFLQNTAQNQVALSLVLSGILTFIQALLINGVVNYNKILPRKNYLPGAVFIIFVSFFKASLLLSPALLSLTFLIVATGRLFNLAKKEKSYGAIYDVGFLTCLAALFYFPAILFLLFAFFGLGTVRAFAYREWTGTLMGYLSPLFVVFVYYFYTDQIHLLPGILTNTGSQNALLPFNIDILTWITAGVLLLITASFLMLLPSALYSSLIQVRKFTGILIFLLVLIAVSAVLGWLLQGGIPISHTVFIALPLSIVASMVLVQIKRKAMPEVIHIILVLLVLTAQYLPLFNLL